METIIVAVVGCGIYGLTAAEEILRRTSVETKVLLLDKHAELPSPEASSFDLNKIVRMEYAKDELYTGLAHESIVKWRQWNQEALSDPTWNRGKLFEECGCYFLRAKDGTGGPGSFEKDSSDTISKLFGETVKTEYQPTVTHPHWASVVSQDYEAYLNRQDGFARSTLTLEWILHKLRRDYADRFQFRQFEFGQIVSDDSGSDGLQSADKSQIIRDYDVVLFAMGAWSPLNLPQLRPYLRATGQPVILLQQQNSQQSNSAKYNFEKFPVFCFDISRTGLYGFPMIPDEQGRQLLKIGIHSDGYSFLIDDSHASESLQVASPKYCTPINGSISDSQISKGDQLKLLEFTRRHFPDLEIVASRICWYCDAIDGHFIIDRLDLPHHQTKNKKRYYVSSGGSGHGFKFAPVLGRICADLILDGVVVDRFRLHPSRLAVASTEGTRHRSNNPSTLTSSKL